MSMPILRSLSVIVLAMLLAACSTTPDVRDGEPKESADVRREGALVFDRVPEGDPALREALQRYQNMRPAIFHGWLPDDSGVLASIRFGDTHQLARIRQPEGMREQLSFFNEPIARAWVSPEPSVNGAIFLKDEGGDEYFQLHFLSFADGSIQALTEGRARNDQVVFAPDGRRYAYSSSRRSGRGFDLWLGELGSTAAHRNILARDGTWYAQDFSADGRLLLVQEWYSVADARIHLLDMSSGELTRIQVGEGTSFDSLARFEPGGAAVIIVSDAGSEFQTPFRIYLADGRVEPLLPAQPWDVEALAFSRDGTRVLIERNVDGSSRIGIHDVAADYAEVQSIAIENGVASAVHFNHASTAVGFAVSGPQVPGDVFSRTLHSGLLTRWTRGETGGMAPETFVSPTLLRYPTFDADPAHPSGRRHIPAFLYQPEGEGPFPVLVTIHGGPEAQARPVFSDFVQFLVRERKVAVLVPNVRGSSGYGKTYLALDDGYLREDAVKDIGALLDWIATEPSLDASRVAVHGGSYGGYMVLASLVHYSDRLRAGIDIVGISHFVTFLEQTNPYRVDQRRPEYGDERDPQMREFLHRISPLTNVERISQPLFVIQGANDPRVPRSEAEQIVAAVRERAPDTWYLLAMDEGHGFYKKGNRDRMTEAVVAFLDRHLAPR
jgi:dipeptidyl aminopeptidase/acylaminoacyl peptidase